MADNSGTLTVTLRSERRAQTEIAAAHCELDRLGVPYDAEGTVASRLALVATALLQPVLYTAEAGAVGALPPLPDSAYGPGANPLLQLPQDPRVLRRWTTNAVIAVAEVTWAAQDAIDSVADRIGLVAAAVGGIGHQLIERWGAFAERRGG